MTPEEAKARLADRIAEALYTAPAAPTDAAERVARRTAARDADVVMDVVQKELLEAETVPLPRRHLADIIEALTRLAADYTPARGLGEATAAGSIQTALDWAREQSRTSWAAPDVAVEDCVEPGDEVPALAELADTVSALAARLDQTIHRVADLETTVNTTTGDSL